jgi:cobalamin biosynthesis Mg chelatase CobN
VAHCEESYNDLTFYRKDFKQPSTIRFTSKEDRSRLLYRLDEILTLCLRLPYASPVLTSAGHTLGETRAFALHYRPAFLVDNNSATHATTSTNQSAASNGSGGHSSATTTTTTTMNAGTSASLSQSSNGSARQGSGKPAKRTWLAHQPDTYMVTDVDSMMMRGGGCDRFSFFFFFSFVVLVVLLLFVVVVVVVFRFWIVLVSLARKVLAVL